MENGEREEFLVPVLVLPIPTSSQVIKHDPGLDLDLDDVDPWMWRNPDDP